MRKAPQVKEKIVTTVYDVASVFLGKSLILPNTNDLWIPMLMDKERREYYRSTFPSQEVLTWCHTHNMILLPGPPIRKSLLDIRALHPTFFKGGQSAWWFEGSRLFAGGEYAQAPWFAIGREPMEGALNRVWAQQQKFLSAPWMLPNAAEVAWCMTAVHALCGVRLFEHMHIHTASMVNGSRVHLGGSPTSLYCDTDDAKSPALGLAKFRRF